MNREVLNFIGKTVKAILRHKDIAEGKKHQSRLVGIGIGICIKRAEVGVGRQGMRVVEVNLMDFQGSYTFSAVGAIVEETLRAADMIIDPPNDEDNQKRIVRVFFRLPVT